MCKRFKVLKHTLIALIACSVLWVVAGIIVAVKMKEPASPSSLFIIALILTLGVLRRSMSISLTACILSIYLMVHGMSPVIDGFQKHGDTGMAVANLLSYIAACFCVIWCCFDFFTSNSARISDRIGHRDGWQSLN